ncbi:hypothetical protein [Pseudomonas mediterranea]|uniref:hypothetical protein n=1 Tax=Pseudomonas mediterranea TaxID=183795 RepID=UPI00128EA6DB|nr:hypothetical protein [Pseudomonas mediterranea]
MVEGGVVKATSDVVFNSNVQVGIYRLGTTVYYAVDEWRYQSLVASSGTKALLGVLYAPGDAIDVPSLGSYAADISAASLAETLTAADAYTYDPEIYGGLTNVLTFSSTAVGDIVIDAVLPEFVTFLDATAPQMTLLATLASSLAIDDTAGASAQGLLQYATNLATGAVGRYNGFDFLGFCRIGMDTYAFKKDGLYKIDADTDDGVPISALIEFAAEALAGTMQSRLVALFYGLSTDGQVFVRITDDKDRETVYRASKRQGVYRANPYQGINSRHWRMRLEIVDASYAELDNVEWVAGSTNRRTTT